jgi:hypothetical protein
MADLFVSYSHRDMDRVSQIAVGLKANGHAVWWDQRLTANQDFGLEIEAALRTSDCAVVAWSTVARDSLWVRAEASEALEARKLVQLSLDGARPPLPFTMIKFLDFSRWRGGSGELEWQGLEHSVARTLAGQPPDTVSVSPRRLGGFTMEATIGASSIGLALLAAALAGAALSGPLPSNWFEVGSAAMFLGALVSFAFLLTRVIQISLASR